MVDPLPHLGAADLRGRRVFHQVEDGDGAASCEPGRDVLHADGDVVAEAVHGDVAFGPPEDPLRKGSRRGFCRAGWAAACTRRRPLWLARPSRGGRPRYRRGRPSSRSLSSRTLLLANSVHSGSSLRGIWAAIPHRLRAALVAGLYGEQRVCAHERHGHGHRVAIGEEHVVFAELLDVGEDVVPPAAVEAGGVLA